MNWTDKYTGIPFLYDASSFDGCDCWGLVRLVYQNELGINLPDYFRALRDNTVAYLRRVHQAAEAEAKRWVRVESPREFDVVLIRKGAINAHVGVVVRSSYFLHCDEGVWTRVERCDAPIWRHRVAGFYRHD